MNNFPLWIRMGVTEKQTKKDDDLGAEITKLKEARKPVKEDEQLNDQIWTGWQGYQRELAIRGNDVPGKYAAYLNPLNRKLNRQGSNYRALEGRVIERDAMLRPIKEDGFTLVNTELKRVKSLYECNWLLGSAHPYLDKIDDGRIDIDTGVRWIPVVTNATAIVEGESLLALLRSKIVNANSIRELQQAFEECEKGLSSLDFTPRKTECRKDEFERLNPKENFASVHLISTLTAELGRTKK